MSSEDFDRFRDLTFERFRQLACDPSLSQHEKVGFPNSYRQNKAPDILADIVAKLSNLKERNQRVLDIGPGCSELSEMLIDLCGENNHELILVDSSEMLDQLPRASFVTRIHGRYPQDCAMLFKRYLARIDAILSYSVFQYAFSEGIALEFFSSGLQLLARGGQMLLGDIPNESKRARLYRATRDARWKPRSLDSSGSNALDSRTSNAGEEIGDEFLLSVVSHCRKAGFDAYLVPQSANLPFANRRDDILITRP